MVWVLLAACGGVQLGSMSVEPGGAVAPALTPPPGGAWVGDLELSSEADIDAFCDSYASVEGDLWLGGADLPAEVEIPCLSSVGGSLEVDADAPLTDLRLDALEAVGEDLRIDGLRTLTTLQLPALRSVGNDLWLADLFDLAVLDLPALEEVGHWLLLDRVDDVEELAFPALQRVEYILVDSCAHVRLLRLGDAMTARPGPDLEVLGGGIESIDAAGVVSLAGLYLAELDALDDVDFSALERVEGEIELQSSPNSGTLRLDALEVVNDSFFVRSDKDSGPEVLDLPRLAHVDGWLYISQAGVRSVGLPALEDVGDQLRISSSDLEEVELGNLYRVEGDLMVSTTSELVELDLGELHHVENLFLSGIQVERLDLDRLEEVDGYLDLRSMPALTDLSGLANLRRVDSYLRLDDLDALEDLSPLHGIESIGGNLTITDNDLLPTSDAEALVAAIGVDAIGGTVTISGNAEGR